MQAHREGLDWVTAQTADKEGRTKAVAVELERMVGTENLLYKWNEQEPEPGKQSRKQKLAHR